MRLFDIFADPRHQSRSFAYRVRRATFRWTSNAASQMMEMVSLVGRRPLIDSETRLTVSLTSHGHRISTVCRTIESIGRGTVRPTRIVLWLDDPDALSNLPRSLKRQMARGLEVRLAENLGPHTKYFPLLVEMNSQRAGFVTADDDIIYPRWWLQRLLAAAQATPGHVVCHRAHEVTCTGTAIAPYAEWTSVSSTQASPTVFATGVSGVLYPPEMTEALLYEGKGFLVNCRAADDIWLHKVALDYGIPVRQIDTVPRHFWITPNSQRTSLMDHNLSGGNDAAATSSYEPQHIDALKRAGTQVAPRSPQQDGRRRK